MQADEWEKERKRLLEYIHHMEKTLKSSKQTIADYQELLNGLKWIGGSDNEQKH